jgi:hypothetical protein
MDDAQRVALAVALEIEGAGGVDRAATAAARP